MFNFVETSQSIIMKIEAYLWTRKNNENKFPIKIRITENRKSQFISINYSISKYHWNPISHRVRSSYEEHEKVNDLIENKIKELQHFKTVKASVFKSKNSLSYINYFENHLIRLKVSNKFGSLKAHNVILKHLKFFLKDSYEKEELLFDEIDGFLLKDLRAYFYGIPIVESTQNGYFKKIKHLYYEAIKDYQFKPTQDPFATFENKSSKAKNKSLTQNELISIEIFNPFQYDFLAKQKVSTRELFDAKNAFLFQFYLRGIRVSDFIFLKWENINNRKIEYVMRKTNKSISVPITHKLLYILRLYMPFSYKEQYFKEGNYADKEMFYSLNKEEKALIQKKIKHKDYYDNFSNYSNHYKLQSEDKLLNKINQLSIQPEYKNEYIFNLLRSSQISKLENASKENFKIIEYNLIQSATALYNKSLKLINNFVFDENGQVIKTPITSHLARHTYASIGVKLGFDVLTISRSLGHMDLKTTQAYINTLDTDFVDDENERLFNTLGTNIDNYIEKTKNKVVVVMSDLEKKK